MLPLPIAIGVMAPVVVFLIAYWMLLRFREFAFNVTFGPSRDTGVARRRIAFLALYGNGVLPGCSHCRQGLAISRSG